MDYIHHPSNNHMFGAPPDWDHSKTACGTLPVTLTEINGQPAIVSFWMPDQAELAALLRGKPVMLSVFGRGHPVVSVGVEAESPKVCGAMLLCSYPECTHNEDERCISWLTGECAGPT
jgi:hypothetical protein